MNTSVHLTLQPIPFLYAICRMSPELPIPEWATRGPFHAIVRTSDELSIVCDAQAVPRGVRAEFGWRAIKLQGPLDFNLTGVLVAVASPLAAAGISILALSTYDTDYVLVREPDLDAATRALREAGHRVL
jgi:uncharacterized protein